MRAKANWRRIAHICGVVVRHGLAHACHARLAKWPRFAAKIAGKKLSGPERLKRLLEDVGGTFIKFGQMLAIQSDIIPLEYCQGLFSLFDNVPAFEYQHVEKTFLEDLHRTPLEVFDYFDPRPIATGSIGQVHVARLGQRKLAVKVRRPTVVQDFGADLAALRLLVRTVKLFRLKSLYWIIQPTEEFTAWTQDELDYRREAHYIDELERYARDNPYERIPVVLWTHTTARILTTDFLEGVTISEYLRNKEAGLVKCSPDFAPEVFAKRLIDNFLGDAFGNGMYHADLHPGNLMIMAGNVVGYIDFGISGVLSRYSRRHLVEMTLAYVCGDTNAMCNSFFRISTFAENVNLQGFRERIKELAVGWYSDDDTQGRLRKSISNVMLDLLILSREKGVWPQRDVVKYIRSAIALDGLINTFAPTVDMGVQLERACVENLKWDALRNLVSVDALDSWVSGYMHLMRDGILRGAAFLNKAGTGPSLTRELFDAKQPKRQKRGAIQALYFSWISLCTAFIVELTQPTALTHLPARAYLSWAVLSILIWRTLKYIRVI